MNTSNQQFLATTKVIRRQKINARDSLWLLMRTIELSHGPYLTEGENNIIVVSTGISPDPKPSIATNRSLEDEIVNYADKSPPKREEQEPKQKGSPQLVFNRCFCPCSVEECD